MVRRESQVTDKDYLTLHPNHYYVPLFQGHYLGLPDYQLIVPMDTASRVPTLIIETETYARPEAPAVTGSLVEAEAGAVVSAPV